MSDNALTHVHDDAATSALPIAELAVQLWNVYFVISASVCKIFGINYYYVKLTTAGTAFKNLME